MFGNRFPRQVAGEVIKASTINAPLDAVEGAMKLGAGPGLAMQTSPGGVKALRRVGPEVQEARITGGGAGGKYSWRGIYAVPGGAWADDDAKVSGTLTIDPCYESNGNATVAAGFRVRMERAEGTGEWRFDADAC